jgi:hypothetical protein
MFVHKVVSVTYLDHAMCLIVIAALSVQDPVVARLRDCIDDFKEILPCVEELINPALKLRHWDEIFDLIGADIPDNDDGTGTVMCTPTRVVSKL